MESEKLNKPRSQNHDSKPPIIGSFIKCPECLQTTSQDELDMFGGLCEECSGLFDE